MGLYDMVKDAASLASKLQNIELTSLLMDIQQNALDMQDQLYQLQRKNQELQDEITELNALWEQEQNVERYEQPYITFRNDVQRIKYCENCWNTSKKKIRFHLKCMTTYECPMCHTTADFPDAEP